MLIFHRYLVKGHNHSEFISTYCVLFFRFLRSRHNCNRTTVMCEVFFFLLRSLESLRCCVLIGNRILCTTRKVKFIYSEKARKFCEIFPLLLTTVHTVKIKGKISQNFVAFSEYMNFNSNTGIFDKLPKITDFGYLQ